MRKYVLYQHINAATNEVFYIGIGNEKRPFQFLHRNDFWNKYTNKHGLPKVEICFVGLSKAQAICYEKMLIGIYGRRGIDACGLLVNRTLGGDGVAGLPVSDETKRKLSERWRGTKRSKAECIKISEGQKGRKLSDTWRKSLSESKKGIKNPLFDKPLSKEHRAKLCGRRGDKHARFGKKNSEESKTKRRITIGNRFQRGGHPCAKAVINDETKEVFNCIKDAWEISDRRITYISFARCLRGEKTNYTGFKLVT